MNRDPQSLSARDLTYLYRRGQRGVEGVHLRVKPGEVCGVLGENGAGKSTLLKLLAGTLRPQRGDLFLGTAKLNNIPLWRRARAGIGYLSQGGGLFEDLTVRDNLLAGLSAWSSSSESIAPSTEKSSLEEVVTSLNLEALTEVKAHRLSGGERRKTELGRLLMMRPSVIILDEPFAALDPKTLSTMRTLIFMLKSKEIGVILSDHQLQHTLPILDRVYLLHQGRLLCEGTPSEIQNHPRARSSYLGQS